MHQIVHEMSFKSVVNVLNSNPKNIHLCNVSRVSYHSGPENLKNPGQKNFVKSNKSISRIFLTKFQFLQFQKWPEMNF